jgi:hypothetical protein
MTLPLDPHTKGDQLRIYLPSLDQEHANIFKHLANESLGKVVTSLLFGFLNFDDLNITTLDVIPKMMSFDVEVLCPVGEPLVCCQTPLLSSKTVVHKFEDSMLSGMSNYLAISIARP